MTIEKLIEKLQKVAAEHPGAEVVVGMHHREVIEYAVEDAAFEAEDDERGLPERAVVFAGSEIRY